MRHPEMKNQRRWSKKKEAPHRTETNQPGLLAETNTGRQENSGWLWCQAREYQIAAAVCIVDQAGEPRKCRGCIAERRG